jgi:hypothetical protein
MRHIKEIRRSADSIKRHPALGPQLPSRSLRRGRRDCRHGRGRESPLGKDIEVLIIGHTRGMPPPNGTDLKSGTAKKSPSDDARALAPN